MNKTQITIIVLAFVILIGVFAWPHKKTGQTDSEVAVTETAGIKGCYAASLANDTYRLNIQSTMGDQVSGTLEYANSEKDSSKGTFVGTYDGSILNAKYAFSSEGVNGSVRQVLFKKTPAGFVEGFGPISAINGEEIITNPSEAIFNPAPIFVPTACDQNFN